MSGGHGHLDHKRQGREGHGRGWTAGLRSRQEGRVVEAQQTGCSDPWVQSWLHHEHSLRPQKGCSTSLFCLKYLDSSWVSDSFPTHSFTRSFRNISCAPARELGRKLGVPAENRTARPDHRPCPPSARLPPDLVSGAQRSQEGACHPAPQRSSPSARWALNTSSPPHRPPSPAHHPPPPRPASPPGQPALDSPPTPPLLSWVYTAPSQRPGAIRAPHPLLLTSRARDRVLLVPPANAQPWPVHATASASGHPRQPRAQLRFAFPAQVPAGSFWVQSDHLILSLPPWLPAARKVKKDLDADLTSGAGEWGGGLHCPFSADCSTLRAPSPPQ